MKINKTIQTLILSDVFLLTGFGLTEPIMAVYINDSIVGGSILTAGVASTIFMVTKAFVQLPFSRYVDSHDDKEDLKWLTIGTFLILIIPFIYIFAESIYHVYLAQILYGVGAGLAYPTWLGLFSTHLDKNNESFEWSFYSTLVALGTSVSATLGAFLAELYGFETTFVLVGLLSLIGFFMLFRFRSLEKY